MDDIISDYPQTALPRWPIVKGTYPLITKVGRLVGISGSRQRIGLKINYARKSDRYSQQIIAILIRSGFLGIILLDKLGKLCLRELGDRSARM